MKQRKAEENKKQCEGFTLVELLIVVVLSFIMIFGMVGLIEMAFGTFRSRRDVQQVTDTARTALSTMERQLKGALYFNDDDCTASQVSFYADVDNDNPSANSNNWTEGEKVVFSKSGANVVQTTTQPTSEGGGVTTANLGGYCSNLQLFYFASGVKPHWNGSTYDNAITLPGDVNKNCGMVKVRLTLTSGKIMRYFERDCFLRILKRG
ncbi:MAG: prepilin-type N-terminal cleavage/methylation domain-containing protein [Actinomycetota bacterium]|nr:prepilin-type N-terminal cleavage/methylation domain-containing protein [Actinomycetota bacterium]